MDVELADLDGDADLDVVWTSQDWPAAGTVEVAGGIDVTITDGAGVFHRGNVTGLDARGTWSFVTSTDIEGDGDMDLVLTRPARGVTQLAVLVNDGAGNLTFSSSVPDVTGNADGLTFARAASGDIDGDGDLDLVVPIFSNTDFTGPAPNVVLVNDGSGAFTKSTTVFPDLGLDAYTQVALVADFTGDGVNDVYLGQAERRPFLLVSQAGTYVDQTLDDGTGTARLPATPVRPYRALAADVDDDADLDILVVQDAFLSGSNVVPGTPFIYRNDGTGHFVMDLLPVTAAGDGRGVAAGDVDGDGLTDIVVGYGVETYPHNGHAMDVLLGGTTGFSLQADVPSFTSGVFSVGVGDVDGDGLADIVAAIAEPGTDGLSNIVLSRP